MVCSLPGLGPDDDGPLRSHVSPEIFFQHFLIQFTSGATYTTLGIGIHTEKGALSRRYFGHVRSGIDAPDFLEHGGPPTVSVPAKYITVLRLISGDGRHQRCFVVSPTFRTKVNKAVYTVFVYTCTIIATNVQDHICIDQTMYKFWFSGGTYKYLISRSLPDKHFFVKIIFF